MRRKIRSRFRTYAPRDLTVMIAAFLWLLGVLDTLFGGNYLPNNLGVDLLVIAGLLLILASVIREL